MLPLPARQPAPLPALLLLHPPAGAAHLASPPTRLRHQTRRGTWRCRRKQAGRHIRSECAEECERKASKEEGTPEAGGAHKLPRLASASHPLHLHSPAQPPPHTTTTTPTCRQRAPPQCRHTSACPPHSELQAGRQCGVGWGVGPGCNMAGGTAGTNGQLNSGGVVYAPEAESSLTSS